MLLRRKHAQCIWNLFFKRKHFDCLSTTSTRALDYILMDIRDSPRGLLGTCWLYLCMCPIRMILTQCVCLYLYSRIQWRCRPGIPMWCPDLSFNTALNMNALKGWIAILLFVFWNWNKPSMVLMFVSWWLNIINKCHSTKFCWLKIINLHLVYNFFYLFPTNLPSILLLF